MFPLPTITAFALLRVSCSLPTPASNLQQLADAHARSTDMKLIERNTASVYHLNDPAEPTLLRRELPLVPRKPSDRLDLNKTQESDNGKEQEFRVIYQHIREALTTNSKKTTRAAQGLGSAESDVALCITGGARTFLLPMVHSAMKKNLVDPLRADVFSILQKMQPGERGQSCEFNTTSLNSIMFEVMGAKSVTLSNADLDLPPLHLCPAPVGGVAAQLAMHDMCCEAVKQHEFERGWYYTTFVHVRPDLFISTPVRADAFLHNNLASPKGDFLFGMPRNYVDNFTLGAWKDLGECAIGSCFEGVVSDRLPVNSSEAFPHGTHQGLARGIDGLGRLVVETFEWGKTRVDYLNMSSMGFTMGFCDKPRVDDAQSAWWNWLGPTL